MTTELPEEALEHLTTFNRGLEAVRDTTPDETSKLEAENTYLNELIADPKNADLVHWYTLAIEINESKIAALKEAN